VASRAAARSDPALLAGWKTLLGELINSAARLRFFPHRAMMFLLLADISDNTADRTGFMAQAEETIAGFRRIVRGFTTEHRAFGVPDALSPWLDELMAVDRAGFDTIAAEFLDTSASIISDMRRGSNGARGRLVSLAKFVATPLFARMNQLVDDFARELADVAVREKELAERTLEETSKNKTSSASVVKITEELSRVNLSVYMISVNAIIQAARSGEAGKAFGVIAVEIQKLSGEIRALTRDIQTNLQT
jgi:hypothetical protein